MQGDDDDYMGFLREKRAGIAAFQAAAEAAAKQAKTLHNLHSRMAEIDKLAAGDGDQRGQWLKSSLTTEDRQRFGLEHSPDVHASVSSSPRERARVASPRGRARVRFSDVGDGDLSGGVCRIGSSVAFPTLPSFTQWDAAPGAEPALVLSGQPAETQGERVSSTLDNSKYWMSSLTQEDRARFGLETSSRQRPANGYPERGMLDESLSSLAQPWPPASPEQPAVGNPGAATVAGAHSESAAASRSSLSREDRVRFGLDPITASEAYDRVRSVPASLADIERATFAPATLEATITWASPSTMRKPVFPSMNQTLADLEALGFSDVSKALRQSEHRLMMMRVERQA